MTAIELAAILGENLQAQAARSGDYYTPLGPNIKLLEYDDDGNDIIVPGTFVMGFDGQIDLIELARAALEALRDVQTGPIEP